MFSKIVEFEDQVAKYYNAPYAVAVDSCTHAIELCLRYTDPQDIACPAHTYISIPFTFIKLGLSWNFTHKEWQDYYLLGGTNIIDAAVYWKKGGYEAGTFMCLSFQHKKHLSLGRGGMILCSSLEDYTELKKMSYDGRVPNIPWAEQNISSIGYHYYMTPETAILGLERLPNAIASTAKKWNHKDYPYLPQFEVFRDV